MCDYVMFVAKYALETIDEKEFVSLDAAPAKAGVDLTPVLHLFVTLLSRFEAQCNPHTDVVHAA